jgi:hypothetical protein
MRRLRIEVVVIDVIFTFIRAVLPRPDRDPDRALVPRRRVLLRVDRNIVSRILLRRWVVGIYLVRGLGAALVHASLRLRRVQRPRALRSSIETRSNACAAAQE